MTPLRLSEQRGGHVGQRGREHLQPLVDMAVAHQQGGGQSDGVGSRGVDHEAPPQRRGDDVLGTIVVERRAEQEPGSSHTHDPVELGEPRPQPGPGTARPAGNVLRFHHRQRGSRRGGGERLAAEGTAVVAR